MSAAVLPVFVDYAGKKREFSEVFSLVFTLFTSFVTPVDAGIHRVCQPTCRTCFRTRFRFGPREVAMGGGALSLDVSLPGFHQSRRRGASGAQHAQNLRTSRVYAGVTQPVDHYLGPAARSMARSRAGSGLSWWGCWLEDRLQFFLLIPYLWRLGVKLRPTFGWSHPAVKKVMLLFAPAALGAGVYQLNVMLSEMIATYLDLEGGLAALQFSTRLTEFTLGCS